jgi:hypothetical protein
VRWPGRDLGRRSLCGQIICMIYPVALDSEIWHNLLGSNVLITLEHFKKNKKAGFRKSTQFLYVF